MNLDIKTILTTCTLVIIILVIYYSVYAQRVKEQKKIKKMQDCLKKGDKIITYSGFSGTIEEVLEERVIVKINPNDTKIAIEKWAIAGIDDKCSDNKEKVTEHQSKEKMQDKN